MHLHLNKKYDRALQNLATSLGFIWGNKANTTALIEAIATGEIELSVTPQIVSPHYPRLKQLIESKQPFKLQYIDVVGKPFQFSCTYAEITIFEEKPYLSVWFMEDRDDAKEAQLKHNRCLRLDRLHPDTNLIELDEPWRENGLDTIEVVFDLFGNLSYAYSKQEGDLEERISDRQVRVTRKISNVFWWMRAIKRYSPFVKIISPGYLAQEYLDELVKAIAAQNLE